MFFGRGTLICFEKWRREEFLWKYCITRHISVGWKWQAYATRLNVFGSVPSLDFGVFISRKVHLQAFAFEVSVFSLFSVIHSRSFWCHWTWKFFCKLYHGLSILYSHVLRNKVYKIASFKSFLNKQLVFCLIAYIVWVFCCTQSFLGKEQYILR